MRRLLTATTTVTVVVGTALLVVFILALTSCGEPAPYSGYVRDKDFRPAYTEEWTTTDCSMRDSKGNCLFYQTNYHSVYHPDRWRFYLENCDEVDKNKKPKCHRGWRAVDQVTWHHFGIGTHYPNPL